MVLDANEILGSVGVKESVFVLDTGALISLVPDQLVQPCEYLDESVTLVDANGGEVKRPMAKVYFKLGSFKAFQKVAVAPGHTLKNKVLLAIDLRKKDELALVVDYSKYFEENERVLSMTTRAQAREDQCEKVAELESQAAKCPRTRQVSLDTNVVQLVEEEPMRANPNVKTVLEREHDRVALVK